MSNKLNARQVKVAAKVVISFLANHKSEVVIVFLVNILIAIGNGIVPYISGKLFDTILHPEKTFSLINITLPQVIWILICLIILQSFLAVSEYLITSRSSKLIFFSRFDYIVKTYSRLLELPISFHKTHKMGDIKSKINLSGYGIQTLVDRLISNIGAELLTVIVAIVIITLIKPEIALFSIIGLAIFLFLSKNSIKNAGGLEDKFAEVWGKAFGNADDSITNISAIKQSTTEKHEQEKLRKGFITKLLPFWLQEDAIWSSLRFNQRIVIIIVQAVVFMWSIRLVTLGNMTIGELIAFNAYLSMLFGPFVNILNIAKTIQSAVVNINTVEKVLSAPTEKYRPVNEVKIDNLKGDVDFQNVVFNYQSGKKVLENINFTIKSGEVVALVGESGVGKSTLVDLLSGYNFPTKGKVLIDNIDIRRLDLSFLRSQIAIVPQEVVLFNESIKTNIKYGNFKASDEQVKEAARKAHAQSFIEKFPKKWNQLVGERGIKLSVGQKQRIAIARAILRDPKILILDEPTSALDAQSEKIIQTALEELMQGRTTFIVAHRLSTVRKADKILVFKEGRVVESGTHQELIEKENGVYRNLYELQVGLHD